MVRWYFILLSFFLLVSCSKENISGSGNIVTEARDIGRFNRIYAGDIFQIIITKGNNQKISIEADDNIIDLVETRIENFGLFLGFTEDQISLNDETILVRIELRDLVEVRLWDDASAVIASFNGLSNLQLNSSDDSHFTASGSVDNLVANLSDDGRIDAFELDSDFTFAELNDASVLSIHSDSALRGSIRDASTLSFTGLPSLEISAFDAAELIDAN